MILFKYSIRQYLVVAQPAALLWYILNKLFFKELFK